MGAASALPRSRYQQKASPQPEALYFAGQMPVISLRRIEISRIALGVDRSLFLCRGFTGGRVGKSPLLRGRAWSPAHHILSYNLVSAPSECVRVAI